jgi:hypothetical protein
LVERQEAFQLLKELSRYYGREPEEAVFELYVQALQDIPAETLSQAAQAHIRESPYFPRISELLRQAACIPDPLTQPLAEGEHLWLAMEALNACLRGELPPAELERRFGRTLRRCLLTAGQLQEHLQAIGLRSVDECPACGGSGTDIHDPSLTALCPSCRGEGYFRIPIG